VRRVLLTTPLNTPASTFRITTIFRVIGRGAAEPLETLIRTPYMKWHWPLALALFGSLMITAPNAHAVDEPLWTSAFRDGPFEVRDYAPTVVAETTVTGERGAAINQGFRRLARYIFGGNEPAREIAMIAPVAQQAAGQRIAMTAPVAQAPAAEGWVVTFYMPQGSVLQDMPRPLDAAVHLRAQPMRRVAVLRFNGLATQGNLSRHEEQLRQHIERHGFVASGPVFYAFYDPPWTLPWMRRNEIMIELQPPAL